MAFQEAYDMIIKAWTDPSMSHHGEFFSIPPSYTKWNHAGTLAYFGMDKVERGVEDVLKLGAPDQYSAGNPVVATTTTLKEISVFPQPLQKPHPQMWEPLTSPRSIEWAAQHGINGYFIAEPNLFLKKRIAAYYEAAEKHDWPDRLQRGPFKFGWDAEKRRGIVTCRYIHLPAARPGPRARARALQARPGDAVALLRTLRLRRRDRRGARRGGRGLRSQQADLRPGPARRGDCPVRHAGRGRRGDPGA